MATSASAAPPEILSSFVSQVGTETAVLKATVNPKGKVVGYRFEYGLSDCSVEPDPCTSNPSLQGTLSTKSTEPEALPSALLEGLTPGTTYHFRLVVQNSSKETTNGPDRAFKTFSPSPAFSPCPNDAFRLGSLAPPGAPSAQLPDCRTYEQASPAYKQGEDARGTPGSVRAAAGGGGITFNTTNGIPGGEGGQEFPTYLATRGSGSWSSQGLSPAQSAGPTAVVLGWSPDFSSVMEMVRQPEEGNPTALLERSSEGGALTTIVPTTPQLAPAFASSNADGSLVLFESKVALPSVAGAIEGKPNLYLWERESGEITLAGALNDTQAPAQGALAGAYDWAAGTSLKTLGIGGALSRGYYTQDNHVMSGDGSAVYFTAAGTGKLYVRLNPTASQSTIALNGKGEGECTEAGKACTVEVSASQRALPDPIGTRPAAFAVATPDGSRALFVSSEKLTEDANTGPEPPASAISRAGVDGSMVEPKFLAEKGAGIAVAGEYLYWADPLSGFLGRAKLNGAGADPEFIQIAGHPRWVAVGGEYLYWSEQGEGEEKGEGLTDEGSIGRVRLDGSEPPEAGIVSGLTDPQGVAVDGEHLYWANHFESASKGYIGRASPDGSGANSKWLSIGGEIPQGVAVNAAGLYWSSNYAPFATSGERFIGRANLNGSGVTRVKISEKVEEGSMRGIALDAGHVYWASSRIGEGDKFEIGRDDLSLSEENLEPDFILIEGKPKGVAVDGEHLYWSLNGEPPVNPGSDLYRFEPGKSAGERLTDLSVDPGEENGAEVRGLLGVSEDGTNVYFAANGVLTNVPNEAGKVATPGDCRGSIDEEGGECETNLYLSRPDSAHPGQLETVFIARVSGADHNDWRPNSAEAANYAPRTSRVTPSGEALLFASHRNLTPYDSEGTSELYLYREGAGIRCVSCNSSGAPPQGAPDLGGWLNLSFLGPTPPAPLLTRSLSSDGQQVFFETTDTLLPGDINGAEGCPVVGPFNGSYPSCLDVYEWEAQGSGSCKSETEGGGCLYLLSPAGSKEASFLGDASASGEDVFLFTRSALVRQDADQLLDAYDARVEGGLASQNVVPSPPCEGDACKPGATGPPPFQGPETPNFQGPANPQKKGCPKGKRKVTQKGKTRCVAKKKKKSNKKGMQKAKKSGKAER